MHELGIITGVVDSTKKVATEKGATHVSKINLKIGEMVEAIEDALRYSFEILSEDDPMLEDCELNIEFAKPKSVCLECGSEFSHDIFHRKCPKCGSSLTDLISGRELEIISIELDKF